MNIAEAMIGEFSQESIGTRKMLERIPDDKLSWKPHEKSMTMGRLATHLAEIPEWAETIMNHESFDMVPPTTNRRSSARRRSWSSSTRTLKTSRKF